MDNITTAPAAPLTRRQAREIERRTGVRPVAVAPARHVELAEAVAADFAADGDTGRIERNAVASFAPVAPVEVLTGVDTAAASASGRPLSVRAAKPAALVAKQRRRMASNFAVAAGVVAVGAAGVVTPLSQGAASGPAHSADLASANATAQEKAVAAAKAQEAVLTASSTKTVVTTIVPAPAAVNDRADITATDDIVEAAPTATAEARTASANTSNSGTAAAGTTTKRAAAPASGSLQNRIYQAALAQVGTSGLDCTDMVQNALAAVGLVQSRFDGGPDLGVPSFYRFGTVISMDEAQPGDILIQEGVPHVAIYAGNGQAVHGGWNGEADDTVVDGLFYSGYTVVRVNG